MEKFACDIENMLQEKLFLYQELKKILEQEKNDIVDMNIDSMWKLVERKKQLGLEILAIRGRILSCCEEKNIPLEVKPFSLSKIINSLPFPAKTKADLKEIKIKLEMVKEEITALASGNKRYTNEYLTVIKGIFATITGAQKKDAYNNEGKVLTETSRKTLIRVEV